MDRTPGHDPWSFRSWLVVGLILLITVLILLGMGRDPWGVEGEPGWWTSEIHSRLNSQRLADPYSFTHVTHGLGLWLVGWLLRDRLERGTRFGAAVALEGGWEVLENTPFVIERFREATLAQGYYGDSVLNSFGDLLFMVGGYLTATWLSVRLVVLVLVALEIALAVWIRDNLVLNVLMLLYPMEPLRTWQLESAGCFVPVLRSLGPGGPGRRNERTG